MPDKIMSHYYVKHVIGLSMILISRTDKLYSAKRVLFSSVYVSACAETKQAQLPQR